MDHTGTAYLTGNVLGNNRDRYELEQFHLHFGCNSVVGSEHTINGMAFPAEVCS